MKKVFLAALTLVSTLAATAQNEKKSTVIENGNETTFIYPAQVTVSKGATTTVRITGETDGAEYTYDITQGENSKALYKETDTDWDFTIPFVNIKETTQTVHRGGRLVIDPTFGFGLIGVTQEGADVALPFGICGIGRSEYVH